MKQFYVVSRQFNFHRWSALELRRSKNLDVTKQISGWKTPSLQKSLCHKTCQFNHTITLWHYLIIVHSLFTF